MTAGRFDSAWTRTATVVTLATVAVVTLGSLPLVASAARSAADPTVASAAGHCLEASDRRSYDRLSLSLIPNEGPVDMPFLGFARFLAANAVATPTFKQVRAKRVTNGAVNSLAFSSANTAGNLIVVYVSWSNTGSVALSDSRGNTYSERRSGHRLERRRVAIPGVLRQEHRRRIQHGHGHLRERHHQLRRALHPRVRRDGRRQPRWTSAPPRPGRSLA